MRPKTSVSATALDANLSKAPFFGWAFYYSRFHLKTSLVLDSNFRTHRSVNEKFRLGLVYSQLVHGDDICRAQRRQILLPFQNLELKKDLERTTRSNVLAALWTVVVPLSAKLFIQDPRETVRLSQLFQNSDMKLRWLSRFYALTMLASLWLSISQLPTQIVQSCKSHRPKEIRQTFDVSMKSMLRLSS